MCANPNKGPVLWVTDSWSEARRQRTADSWDRALGDLVIANLSRRPRDGVNRDTGEIVWDQKVAGTNEFGNRERFFAAPITAEARSLSANARRRPTRGWLAALDARRARNSGGVCRPEAG